MVELEDKAGEGVADTEVRLIADPAGYPTAAQGSWLHPLGFRQLAVTSAQGQVRGTAGAYHGTEKDSQRLHRAAGCGDFQPGTSG